MIEIATIDWFGRWGTSVFSENTAIFSILRLISEQFSWKLDMFFQHFTYMQT